MSSPSQPDLPSGLADDRARAAQPLAVAMRAAHLELEQGRAERAAAIARSVLAAFPSHGPAEYMLGVIAARSGRLPEAALHLERAAALNASAADVQTSLATVYFAMGRHDEALLCCDRALSAQPDGANAWLVKARVLRAGRHLEAAAFAYDRVCALEATRLAAWIEAGETAAAAGHADVALGKFERALALNPASSAALNGRGAALSSLGKFVEALACFDSVLAQVPTSTAALQNRANALRALGRVEDALATYELSIQRDRSRPEAWYNRGTLLLEQRRTREALACFERALGLRPDFADAWSNKGAAFAELKQLDRALESYSKALEFRPKDGAALYNRGVALAAVGRHQDAVTDLEAALRVRDSALTRGALLGSKLHCCDWRDYAAQVEAVTADVRSGQPAIEPFTFLAIASCPADERLCADTWIRHRYPEAPRPLWNGERYGHGRIRVAYISGAFRDHPIARVAAGLFEHHDRSRFEVFALSRTPSDGSPLRGRLEGAFEHFVDVHALDEAALATRIRELEIDIAVDLNSLTAGGSLGTLARRPAPIQVAYLGYPGTCGAPYVDYLLADEIVVPRTEQPSYSERVIYLPGCYHVNDALLPSSSEPPRRSECGLPDEGFVFCCFNNVSKISPPIFDLWMELLRAVSDSVLWLGSCGKAAATNLRAAAAQRGVDPARIVFASRVSHEAHLARHQAADVFLDTVPFNAHSTAADSLRAGLPVLTMLGTTFAGRVAASHLISMGLPELVARSTAEYREKALELARRGDWSAALRDKVMRNRQTSRVFDPEEFRRHLEGAYTTMMVELS